MKRKSMMILMAAALAVSAAGTAGAALLTKTFQFKPNTSLEVTAEIGDGLRLDTIQFYLPSTIGGPLMRTGGVVKAEIAVSNIGKVSRMFGIAIALLDDEGRLLGAANGGPKFFPLKPDRQGTYTLIFDGVNGEAYKTTLFKVTVESKP